MSKINKITPLTNVKFLNLYELEAENKFGDTHPYYVASRKNENIMMAATKEVIPDGVVIYSLFGEKADHLIMVRQFRYPLNDYIYELPAGLIDPGESIKETAIREMKEETGLTFTPAEFDDFLSRPHFSSAGMTDETNCTPCTSVHKRESKAEGYRSGMSCGRLLRSHQTPCCQLCRCTDGNIRQLSS